MPNQLARSKRRHSLAEHEAVLAALAAIARRDGTTVTALLREAARSLVRAKTATPSDVVWLSRIVSAKAPRMPARFESPSEVARFKRAQRDLDRVRLDLGLARPSDVQERSSILPATRSIRVLELDRAHAAASR